MLKTCAQKPMPNNQNSCSDFDAKKFAPIEPPGLLRLENVKSYS